MQYMYFKFLSIGFLTISLAVFSLIWYISEQTLLRVSSWHALQQMKRYILHRSTLRTLMWLISAAPSYPRLHQQHPWCTSSRPHLSCLFVSYLLVWAPYNLRVLMHGTVCVFLYYLCFFLKKTLFRFYAGHKRGLYFYYKLCESKINLNKILLLFKVWNTRV